MRKYVPFWDTLDLDRRPYWNVLRIFLFRLFMQMVQVHVLHHPDENWQALQLAYDIVYGRVSGLARGDPARAEILLCWEHDSRYALRNSLYPFWLALPARLLRLLSMDTNFLVVNSMYFMHCIVWSFGDYFYFHLVKLLAGKRCAILTLMAALSNQTVNLYLSRTSSNGVESSLAIAAFYYYHKLERPRVFDADLRKMTFLITLSFLIRSSSLAPWIPLAALKILEDAGNFRPILVAGLTVAIPTMCCSVLLDSYYYGVLTVPQLNFVYFNVIQNKSKYFGTTPYFTYIHGLRDEFSSTYYMGLFGLSLLTIQQLQGSLEHYNKARGQLSKIPSIAVFMVAYLVFLSFVGHKELRFYAPIVLLGCFAQAFAFEQLFHVPALRRFLKYLLIALLSLGPAGKMAKAAYNDSSIQRSMLEPYLIFNDGRFPGLSGNSSAAESPAQVESVYFFDKFFQPPHLVLHQPSWRAQGNSTGHQTTTLYQSFGDPIFINDNIPDLSTLKHPEFPELSYP